MNVTAIPLPSDLTSADLIDRSVVVFDVLRATTTITAALSAGVREIRIFGDTASAQAAATAFGPTALLCGEVRCLPPPGFDLGNSPRGFQSNLHRDKTVFFSTTNGTRAILAAADAPVILAGALVNATAVARRLLTENRDVTLLCAGTGGQIAMEDLIGAGAVFDALANLTPTHSTGEMATIARTLFHGARSHLEQTLRESTGGRNVLAAGLDPDITFAAKVDRLDLVGVVRNNPLRVVI